MATLTQPAYLLEHDWEQEPQRLKLLEEHADPTTIRRLRDAGVRRGWNCLEVGAGRGSIATWLCEQVGASGQVTALDLDTSLLGWLASSNLEVVEGDVLEIELQAQSFDLIHTRLVLMHIPERRRALERMIRWLRPGGCLVVEELDWMAMQADCDPERSAMFRAYQEALPTIDFGCGRALLGELTAAGLRDTTADVRVDVVDGGTPRAQWDQLSMVALMDQVLDAGTATIEQIEAHLAKLSDPDYRAFGWAWVGARGRRGAAAG
jgi:trans-aconitate methyltransferase